MLTLLVLLETVGIAKFGAALGAAISVIGAALGIGNIGSKAMDAIARQPESADDIRSNMIVAAALIEGVAFFSIVIALLIVVL
jgi:F-type H+-transporting ATPase subunit c